MRCIGFGKHEGICTNEAGTKWSPLWCSRCNRLRLAHIDTRFGGLLRTVSSEGGENDA